MKKSLSRKPARATQNAKFEMSPAMQARMEKAMISIGNIAGKQARKDDKVQREARFAIAETFDGVDDDDAEVFVNSWILETVIHNSK